ncbi:MAG: hypothetical protein D6726_01580 [Nitrospirae bacterium]|nr:MAG: hypothetical protein D6726_01580 [Nitrospirota bacterium]
MRRTLYLCQSRGIQVRVDGPSLWITQEGVAGRRVPFQMVEHAVILGNINLETDVLSTLSEHNIPVTIFSRKGENTTMLVCYNEKFPPYYHKQKLFYRQPHGKNRYLNIVKHWRRKTEIYALKRYSKKLFEKAKNENFKDGTFQKIIKSETLFLQDRYKMVYRLVRGLLCQLILTQVRRAQLDPSLGVIFRHHPHGLVLDIAYMLDPEVHLQTLRFFNKKGDEILITNIGVTSEGMRDIALRFENRRASITELVRRVIGSIIEGIRDLEAKAEIRRTRRGVNERALPYML